MGRLLVLVMLVGVFVGRRGGGRSYVLDRTPP